MRDLSAEVEEAAASLDASRWRDPDAGGAAVAWPRLADRGDPGLRAGGGGVRLGDLHRRHRPFKSEIAPLLIPSIQLGEFNYQGAAAIALALLLVSFAMLLVLQRRPGLARRFYPPLSMLSPPAKRADLATEDPLWAKAAILTTVLLFLTLVLLLPVVAVFVQAFHARASVRRSRP